MKRQPRRLGTFRVQDETHRDYNILRAAQEGCAVTRCEYLGYADAFEIYAEHPDFDEVEMGIMIPAYDVELEQLPDGQIRRKAFVRQGNAAK